MSRTLPLADEKVERLGWHRDDGRGSHQAPIGDVQREVTERISFWHFPRHERMVAQEETALMAQPGAPLWNQDSPRWSRKRRASWQ